MRQSDYPLPGYAASCWHARGKFFLARCGKGTVYFEDTPDGLAELRVALLACGDQRALLGGAREEAREAREARAALQPARVKVGVSGRPKLTENDLWGGEVLT